MNTQSNSARGVVVVENSTLSTIRSAPVRVTQDRAGSAVARMLQARSVAVVGASARPGSLGERMVHESLRDLRDRRLHLINPSHGLIAGHPAVPSLSDVTEPVDLVLLGVGDERLVEQVELAARHGVGGVVVFGSATDPRIRTSVQQTARHAGMALCGAGCMGFLNARTGLRALGYQEPDTVPTGPISVITHSGSVFSALLRTGRGLGFDLVVSSGQELVTTTADYVDHIVDHTSTRVLALVLETVRDGSRLIASLRRARSVGIDVVVLPLGGSQRGAQMVASHSGAVAGGGATWEATCEATGSIRVGDLAELVDTIELLACPRRPTATGAGLATVHDSGGERSLLVDLAEELEVPLAVVNEQTRTRIAQHLDVGLDATNPLDVWGGGRETRELFGACLQAMTDDDGVAVTALAVDLIPEYDGDTSYCDAVLDVAAAADAPLVVLTSIPAAVDRVAAGTLRAAGVPVLEGLRSGLGALRHLIVPPVLPPLPTTRLDPVRRAAWQGRLSDLDALGARQLLTDYGIDSPRVHLVTSEAQATAAALDLGGRVVLKTARPDLAHKTEVGGVVVDVAGPQVAASYERLADRLGPQVTVHELAAPGVEISVGMVQDPQLGPVVVVAMGGVLVELYADHFVLLPPLTAPRVRAGLDRLRAHRLLDGWRGAAPVDRDALVGAILAVGCLAEELGEELASLEINPLVAHARGVQALDLLIATRTDPTRPDPTRPARSADVRPGR